MIGFATALAIAVLAGVPAIGSVPDEVAAYVSSGALAARLDQVYGTADADGIDFDETTVPGTVVRVHVWTDELLAGAETDHPVRLVNEWIVPISVDEQPVGLATIWINPDSDLPELAEFEPDPALAVALSEVPDAAALVRDDASGAWLALEGGTATPLVAGESGLSTPVPLAEVPITAPPVAAPEADDSGAGIALAIGAGAVLLTAIGVALLTGRARARAGEEGDEGDDGPSA